MRKLTVLFSVITFLLIAHLTPPAMYAQSTQDCNSLVYDGAKLFGGNTSSITNAAQSLKNKGAEVHVWTQNAPAGFTNIDQYWPTLLKSCPSWQNASGGIKANLVGVVVIKKATGGEDVIKSGPSMTQLNDQTNLGIQKQTMEPKFAKGDFSGGVTDGLNQLTKLVSTQPAGSTTNGVATNKSTSQASSGGSSLTWLWIILAALVITAVIGYIVFIWLPQRNDRRLARQKAQNAKSRSVNLISNIGDQIKDTDTELQILEGTPNVDAGSLANLKQRFGAVKKIADNASVAYESYNTPANDPDRPNLTVGEAAEIEQNYNRDIVNKLTEASTQLADIKRDAQRLSDNPAVSLSGTPQPAPSQPVDPAPQMAAPQPAAAPIPPQVTSYTQPISRNRQEANRMLDDANDVLRQAERFIWENWRFVSFDTKDALQSARNEAVEAERTRDNDRRYNRAANAYNRARDTFEAARSDVISRYDYSRDRRWRSYRAWNPWYDDNLIYYNTVFMPAYYPDEVVTRQDVYVHDERSGGAGVGTGFETQPASPRNDDNSGSGSGTSFEDNSRANEGSGIGSSWTEPARQPDPEPYSPPSEPSYSPPDSSPMDTGGSLDTGSGTDMGSGTGSSW